MADPEYYELGESRWLSDPTRATNKGDPYYYGIGGVGQVNDAQPWSMQTGPQPKFMGKNSQPDVTSNRPAAWAYLDGKLALNAGALGQAHPSFMLGDEPMLPSIDYQGRRSANGLGELPADYQGRRWANGLGEIPYAGLGFLSEPGTLRAMFTTIAISALVSAGVCYYMNSYR